MEIIENACIFEKDMKIKKIITRRFRESDNAYQLVFEWEDIFKTCLGASFSIDFNLLGMVNRLGKLYSYLPLTTRKPALIFEMNPCYRWTPFNNRPNIVTLLVDFYYRDEADLQSFYKAYNRNRLVLVSSAEVYEYLLSVKCPLPIEHLALSISDKYRISPETRFSKQFDVLLMGRQNPVLQSFLDKYVQSHPDLLVVSCRKEKGHWNYYDRFNRFYGCADTREGCMDLLRKSRIGLFSTKGMDGDHGPENLAYHGFSQVTPRLLEYMVTGNHVLTRYANNADTRFYELEKMFKNILCYEDFELEMNKALSTDVDMAAYSHYLEKHYTSVRVKQLLSIIEKL